MKLTETTCNNDTFYLYVRVLLIYMTRYSINIFFLKSPNSQGFNVGYKPNLSLVRFTFVRGVLLARNKHMRRSARKPTLID